jgi:hypothetical protein
MFIHYMENVLFNTPALATWTTFFKKLKGTNKLYTKEDWDFYASDNFPYMLYKLFQCPLCVSFWTGAISSVALSTTTGNFSLLFPIWFSALGITELIRYKQAAPPVAIEATVEDEYKVSEEELERINRAHQKVIHDVVGMISPENQSPDPHGEYIDLVGEYKDPFKPIVDDDGYELVSEPKYADLPGFRTKERNGGIWEVADHRPMRLLKSDKYRKKVFAFFSDTYVPTNPEEKRVKEQYNEELAATKSKNKRQCTQCELNAIRTKYYDQVKALYI